jgi:hypothetical protein
VPPINLGRAGLPILQKNHEEGECLLLKGLDYLFFRRIMKWGSASFSSRKGWTVLTLEVKRGNASYLTKEGLDYLEYRRLMKRGSTMPSSSSSRINAHLQIPSCGLFLICRGKIGTLL